jgi:hypothetical protein
MLQDPTVQIPTQSDNVYKRMSSVVPQTAQCCFDVVLKHG